MLEWVALVALVGVFLEELAIWIRQELVTLEREADRVLFQPRFLASQSLWLIGRWLDFDFAQVVAELVIGDDEGVRLAGILNAIAIVIVLRWSLNHDTFCSHLVESADRVRQL